MWRLWRFNIQFRKKKKLFILYLKLATLEFLKHDQGFLCVQHLWVLKWVVKKKKIVNKKNPLAT